MPSAVPAPMLKPPSWVATADKFVVKVLLRGMIHSTEAPDALRSIPELDAEAVRVVEEEWLFRPAMKNGRPVASLAELVVTFNLY